MRIIGQLFISLYLLLGISIPSFSDSCPCPGCPPGQFDAAFFKITPPDLGYDCPDSWLKGSTISGNHHPDGKTPVIVIHGILNGIQGDTKALSNYLSGNADLQRHFDVYTFEYEAKNDIDTNGFYLSGLIREVFGDRPFILIGHSMGGLVGRVCLERYGLMNQCLRLITLGTPHHGSPIANGLWNPVHPLITLPIILALRKIANGWLDLAWDNFDNETPLEAKPGSSKFLTDLNTKFWGLSGPSSKYVFYGGYSPDWIKCLVCSFDGYIFTGYYISEWTMDDSYSANDGIVPLVSSLFLRAGDDPLAVMSTISKPDLSDVYEVSGPNTNLIEARKPPIHGWKIFKVLHNEYPSNSSVQNEITRDLLAVFPNDGSTSSNGSAPGKPGGGSGSTSSIPSRPSGLQPSDGSTFPSTTSNVTLSWSVPAGATSFDIRVDDTTDPESPRPFQNSDGCNTYVCLNDQKNTYITVPVKAGHRYGWRLSAKNSAGRSSETNQIYFTIDNAPLPPTNLSPGGNQEFPFDTAQVTLMWAVPPGAISYDLRVVDETNPDSPRPFPTDCNSYVCKNGLGDNHFDVPVSEGHQYSWRVSAGYPDGRSVEAEERFRIGENPLRDGNFLKEKNSQDVYVIYGGAKFKIPNPDQFAKLGGSWDKVIGVPDGWLSPVPTDPKDGTYLYEVTSKDVFIVYGKAKFHVSIDDFDALGLMWTNVGTVPDGALSSIRTIPVDGTLLRERNQEEVYVVYGGARFHVTNIPQFVRMGLSWDNVRVVPVNALSIIPTVPPSVPNEGTLLREVSSEPVYMIKEGKKYHISDIDEFVRLALSWSNVGVVPEGALASIPDFIQNHPPQAFDGAVTTEQDMPADIALSAYDGDGDALIYHIETQPAHGNLGETPPTLNYSPSPGFIGTDSFTFSATDGKENSNTASVTVTVFPHPIAIAPPVIGVSAGPLAFTGEEAGPNPEVQTLQIRNDGGGTLNWTAQVSTTTGDNWLFITNTDPSASTLTLSVYTAGLLPGVYNGSLTISAPNATNASVVVPVSLTVEAVPVPQPITIQINPSDITLKANETHLFQVAPVVEVTWFVDGGDENGTIDSSGNYQAPAVVSSPQDVTIWAISTNSVDGIGMATVHLLPSVTVPVLGDLNGDNNVNIADITLLLQNVVGLTTLTPDQIKRGDVAPVGAPDGALDLRDVTHLLRFAVGLETSLG